MFGVCVDRGCFHDPRGLGLVCASRWIDRRAVGVFGESGRRVNVPLIETSLAWRGGRKVPSVRDRDCGPSAYR